MMETKLTVGVGTALSGAMGPVGEKGQGCDGQLVEVGCQEGPEAVQGVVSSSPGLDSQSGVPVTFMG